MGADPVDKVLQLGRGLYRGLVPFSLLLVWGSFHCRQPVWCAQIVMDFVVKEREGDRSPIGAMEEPAHSAWRTTSLCQRCDHTSHCAE